MNNGYIRLHRKFLEWEWLQNPNDVSLFIHLLLMTNWKDSKYKDIDVLRGSLVTGRKELAKKVGVSEQQIRTSLNHLKSTNVITIKSYSKFSIITIKNYDKYQIDNQEDNQQVTNKQPASNQQVTTSEKSNKVINIKESISKDIPKKVFLKPSIDEIKKYCQERNNKVDAEKFYNFYESKGWMIGKNKMKNWKACIRTWEQRDKADKQELPVWFDKEYEENKKGLEELEKLLEDFK